MNLVFVTLLLTSSLNAAYEKIKIGTISSEHKNNITVVQLKKMIDEIEYIFESQLGFNVFDYSSNGKPIDILYVSKNAAEKRLNTKIASYERKVKKSHDLLIYFDKAKKDLDTLQNKYNVRVNDLNKNINSLNNYVNEVNKKRAYPKDEYTKIKAYIKKEKEKINIKKKDKNLLETKLRLQNSKYNNKVLIYNNLISQINNYAFEIESLTRNLKIIKGQALGVKKISYKTYIKNGQYINEKKIENSMNKIEIYSFKSLAQLKVILAHEIAHLVGIPHINVKGALMNPLLQDNQIKDLKLSFEDIQAFKKYFNK